MIFQEMIDGKIHVFPMVGDHATRSGHSRRLRVVFWAVEKTAAVAVFSKTARGFGRRFTGQSHDAAIIGMSKIEARATVNNAALFNDIECFLPSVHVVVDKHDDRFGTLGTATDHENG